MSNAHTTEEKLRRLEVIRAKQEGNRQVRRLLIAEFATATGDTAATLNALLAEAFAADEKLEAEAREILASEYEADEVWNYRVEAHWEDGEMEYEFVEFFSEAEAMRRDYEENDARTHRDNPVIVTIVTLAGEEVAR